MIALQRITSDLAKAQKAELDREISDREKIKIVAFCYYDANSSVRVMVKNIGVVSAYDVCFTFESRAGYESPEIKGEIDENFPVAEFKPGYSVNFLIAPCDETGDNWPAVISWRDRENKKDCNRIILRPNAA